MASEARVLTRDNALQVAAWCKGRVVGEQDALDTSVLTPGINLQVHTGDIQRASMGDTIIRRNDGTFEIFKNI
jgi:hypothetical protein